MAADRPLNTSGLIDLLKRAARKWLVDRAPQMGAALAYYAAFAVAPLLVVAVSVAGLVAGEQAVEGEIVTRLEDTLGRDTAAFVEGMVESARGGGGIGGTVLGLAIGFFAASALAINLRRMLNAMWGVPHEQQSGLAAAVKARLVAFAVVAGAGLLVVVVIGASGVLAALDSAVGSVAVWLRLLLEVANVLVGIALTAVAFAVIFKVLPVVKVGWRESLLGGTVAGVLFTVGSWGLARYIGSGAVGRGFGAATALIILLVFVYYSAQLVLFGAEVSVVSAESRPVTAVPSAEPPPEQAEPVSRAGAFTVGLLLGAWARRRSR